MLGSLIRHLFTLIILILVGLLISPKIAHNAVIELEVYQVSSEPLTEVQFYAFERVLEEFGPDHWDEYYFLIQKESGFDPEAQNPKSTAYGIHQFLDSTWSSVACEKTSDPYEQIDCGIEYIKIRYGNPQLAWQHSIDKNWY